MPGDIPPATIVNVISGFNTGGASIACGATAVTTPLAGSAGNTEIEGIMVKPAASAVSEATCFWTDMRAAKVMTNASIPLDGTYGATGPATAMTSKLYGAFTVGYSDGTGTLTTLAAAVALTTEAALSEPGNFIVLSSLTTAGVLGNLLTTNQMVEMDLKIDDGKPSTGVLQGTSTTANLCATAGASISLSTYTLADVTACSAHFKM